MTDLLDATRPDVDTTIEYPTHNRTVGSARLRVWYERRVAVLSEIEENEGMSITNAAEFAWTRAEKLIGVEGVRLNHPSWRLIEHYPSNSQRSDTYDVVTFTARDDSDRLARPSWCPLHLVDDVLWVPSALRLT